MQALSATVEKVLLVVDDDGKLLGCLSDGDLRRYILNGNDLQGTVADAYNNDPVFMFSDEYDRGNLKKLFLKNRVQLIPIIGRDFKVVDFVDWENILGNDVGKSKSERKLSAKVIIMAGGKGSRLDPFTRVLPKPLLPFGDSTIIELIIDKFRKYGINDYYLTINHMSKLIKAYFEERNPDYNIHFIEEEKPLGTAGSLNLLDKKVKGSLFVSNCDIIIDADYAELYDFHIKNDFDITLVASLKNFNIPYGICEVEVNGSLKEIKEKPEFSFLVNTGLYLLKRKVIDHIPEGKFYHITDLITTVKNIGGKVGVYPVGEDEWIDVGEWAEQKESLNKLKNW